MEKIKCDICGGDSFLIHKGTRDNPNIDVYECSECHTKLLSSIDDRDYESGFMNGKFEMSSEEIKKRLAECEPDDVRRAKMVAEYCKDKNVLDFGCGFGGFMSNIKNVAKNISGVELGLTERNYLSEKNFEVKKLITDYKKKFDVITLFHVFEHLNNPRDWLNIFADYMGGGDGILFIEVPNSNDILLSLYENKNFADFTYWSAHLYLYTKESLTKLIEENGRFKIESAGQIQRYPISNHLYWLAKGKPGGHKKWNFFNDESLNSEYEKVLKNLNACDTLFYRLTLKTN